MTRSFGCNTLYPYGRITDVAAFDLAAQRAALGIIAEAGLDGCEFSHFGRLAPAEQEALHAACARLGIQPWSAHAWIPLPAEPERVADTLPGLEESLAGAARLGVKILVLHAATAPPEANGRRAEALAAALENLAPKAVRNGICLALENTAGRQDLEFLVGAVDRLGLDGVGFNIDTGHAVLHGMTPPEAIRLMGSRLVTTHLQDNLGQRDDHLPPGRGTIEWAPIREALDEVGYRGMLMAELSDCPPGREPDAVGDTREAARFLRALFAVTGRGPHPNA